MGRPKGPETRKLTVYLPVKTYKQLTALLDDASLGAASRFFTLCVERAVAERGKRSPRS